MKAALDGKSVKIDAKVGEEGQLFGSVTSQMIADAIASQLDVTVDRKRIELNRAIKTAGVHEVVVNFYRDIDAKLTLQVGTVVAPEPEPEPETTEADTEVETEASTEVEAETTEENAE
jgi:large subunit ribosomal protein L9